MLGEVIYGLDNLLSAPAGPQGQRCAVTIGNFDGVHRGHQRLLAAAREMAHAESAPAVAVTFDPPPARLLAPERAAKPLMHLDQRCQALRDCGADLVLVLSTTHEMLHMTPEQFVRDVLVARLHPRHVVEGRSFFFGRNRAGNVETLQELSGQYDFAAHVAEPVSAELTNHETVAVSSSLVRRLVGEGRVADAARCLGRPYALAGQVVSGAGRGRTMKFPTANLDCGPQLKPADGVYAGWAHVGETTYPAAVSIGNRPTFGFDAHAIEAFLLGGGGDLYGRHMTLEIIDFVRPQERFASTDELIRQMNEDVLRVQSMLET
jgi:riboflavin kinase/FMN adenylyltransferase